ncbi:hypothetical protein LINGRAHAP2_LOCUS4470 [Linum grandiflorum]
MELEQSISSSSRSQYPMPRLRKMMSWSPETQRDEVWRRRKEANRIRRRNRTLTDEDLDELNGCMELGFRFNTDSPDLDPRLSDTLPALGLYYAVHKQYNHHLSRTSSASSILTSISDGGSGGGVKSQLVVDTGKDPEMVKARLRQWARMVACSVKQIAESERN